MWLVPDTVEHSSASCAGVLRVLGNRNSLSEPEATEHQEAEPLELMVTGPSLQEC